MTTPEAEVRTLAPDARSAVTSPAAAAPSVHGLVDNATADRLYGWAWDSARPDDRLTIELRLRDEVLETACADLPRPDLARNGIGDGCHAFEFGLRPDWLKQAADLAVVARLADGEPVPIPVRIRRPDDAAAGVQLQQGLQRLGGEHGRLAQLVERLRAEVATRPDATALAGLAQRLDQVELWLARLEARLPPPDPGAGAAPAAVPAGVDPWLAALIALLASIATGVVALAAGGRLG